MNGGQRVATMLMYLSDVESGGETVFPDSDEKPASPTTLSSYCARTWLQGHLCTLFRVKLRAWG